MEFAKKYLNIFLHVFGLLTVVFMAVAVPITIYYSFVSLPKSALDISNDCLLDLQRSSQELRESLVRETEQAKRWNPQVPLLQHWLFIESFVWNKTKWDQKESAANGSLINLYQVTPGQISNALSHTTLPHLLSQELELEELEVGKTHLLTLLTIEKNRLFAVVLPPASVQNSLSPSRFCKKTVLKSNGDFLFANSSKKTLDELLVELQSSAAPATNLTREIYLTNRHKFAVKNVLTDIFLVSEIDQTHDLALKTFWGFSKTIYFLAYVFLIWGGLLLTRILFNRQKFIINTVTDMSNGLFRPFQKEVDDPLFSKIQNSIIAFSNQHLNRLRTFSRQIKLHHLKNSSLPVIMQEQGFKMYNSVVLQIDVVNFESVFFDYKFHSHLGELNSLWANICEMLEDNGSFVDNLSGGSIRAIWTESEINRPLIEKIAKLVFEIQDLVNSINKHRFMNNSSPYKIAIGVHMGDLILTQLGPLERKEFTGIGPCLSVLYDMLHVARINQSNTIVSEQIYEFLNKSYLFTVLNTDNDQKKYYTIHPIE